MHECHESIAVLTKASQEGCSALGTGEPVQASKMSSSLVTAAQRGDIQASALCSSHITPFLLNIEVDLRLKMPHAIKCISAHFHSQGVKEYLLNGAHPDQSKDETVRNAFVTVVVGVSQQEPAVLC